jgi:hypothetical protein
VRGSSVRWGCGASSSTSSSSACPGTSAHVATSTAAATAAQADSKHNVQAAEQAIVEQEQEQLEAMTLQQGPVAAAGAAGTAVGTAAGQALVLSQPSAAAAAAASGYVPAGPPPLWLARFCAGWVHASLGTVGVSLLEKQKRWGEAVEVSRKLGWVYVIAVAVAGPATMLTGSGVSAGAGARQLCGFVHGLTVGCP